MRIDWTLPTSNGEAITAYLIKIQAADGLTYIEDLTNCNGADPTIRDQRYCEIPMSVLRASPYSLTYGMTVKAIVQAFNINGGGYFSQVNLVGATIQTVPMEV